MQSGGKILILRDFKETNWDTLDSYRGENMWRFKFLECKQNVLYQLGLDVQVYHQCQIQSHSILEIKSITDGPPLGKSDQLVIEMDYIVKEEELKGKEIIQNRRKYKEGT